mmetsp:Transcript_466/g.885  ORF Transcript_466/g.885 Transcript_466/m.885 type:complete len:373 (+) Transcript_466:1-1119(+)
MSSKRPRFFAPQEEGEGGLATSEVSVDEAPSEFEKGVSKSPVKESSPLNGSPIASSEDHWDDECYSCQKGIEDPEKDPLLLCEHENCSKACHLQCTPAAIVPEGQWYCCRHNNSRALRRAARLNDVAEIDAVLAEGLHVDEPDLQGRTALHVAATHGKVQAAERLLKASADVDAIDEDSATPLHRASERGDVELVSLLLQNNADVDAVDDEGMSALHLAAMKLGKEYIAVVQTLLKAKADPHLLDEEGETCLHRAAEHGEAGALRLLLHDNPDINKPNPKGRTPLHLAALKGRDACLGLLVQSSAQVDALDSDGRTALHLASRASLEDNGLGIRLLLQAGADASIQDKKGYKPEELIPASAGRAMLLKRFRV